MTKRGTRGKGRGKAAKAAAAAAADGSNNGGGAQMAAAAASSPSSPPGVKRTGTGESLSGAKGAGENKTLDSAGPSDMTANKEAEAKRRADEEKAEKEAREKDAHEKAEKERQETEEKRQAEVKKALEQARAQEKRKAQDKENLEREEKETRAREAKEKAEREREEADERKRAEARKAEEKRAARQKKADEEKDKREKEAREMEAKEKVEKARKEAQEKKAEEKRRAEEEKAAERRAAEKKKTEETKPPLRELRVILKDCSDYTKPADDTYDTRRRAITDFLDQMRERSQERSRRREKGETKPMPPLGHDEWEAFKAAENWVSESPQPDRRARRLEAQRIIAARVDEPLKRRGAGPAGVDDWPIVIPQDWPQKGPHTALTPRGSWMSAVWRGLLPSKNPFWGIFLLTVLVLLLWPWIDQLYWYWIFS